MTKQYSNYPPPRKANECIETASRAFQLRSLFDDFWSEGELALLYGASGAGKSILAVQIAVAIARGRALPGFEMPAHRMKVLYADLDMSEKQFRPRCIDGENKHEFPTTFFRDRPPSLDKLTDWVREMIVSGGFRVVIIDSLASLKLSADGVRETLPVMRGLKKIVDELDVSILVVTDAEPPAKNATASEADLRRSRILCSTVDSSFALAANIN